MVVTIVGATAAGAPPAAALPLAVPVRRSTFAKRGAAAAASAAATTAGRSAATPATDNNAANTARRAQLRLELQCERADGVAQQFTENGFLPSRFFVQDKKRWEADLDAVGIELTDTIGPRCHVVVVPRTGASASAARATAKLHKLPVWAVRKLLDYLQYENTRKWRTPRWELQLQHRRQVHHARTTSAHLAARRRRRQRAPQPPKCGVTIEQLFSDRVFTIPEQYADAMPAAQTMVQRVSHEARVVHIAASLHATFVGVAPKWTELTLEVCLWMSPAMRADWRRSPEVFHREYASLLRCCCRVCFPEDDVYWCW